jgi:hypothetical protein
MDLKCASPRKGLFRRQLVDAPSLLSPHVAAAHRRDHCGLSTDYPSLGALMWQILYERRPARWLTEQRFHRAHWDAEVQSCMSEIHR